MSGFKVRQDDLHGASSTISSTVAAFGGSKVGDLGVSGESFGHAGLFEAFSAFCTGVHAEIEAMCCDADAVGGALSGSATSYGDTESDTESAFLGGLL